MEKKKELYYYLSELHDNFNWHKVHKAMIAVQWYWYLGQDSSGTENKGIPSLETIKNHAHRLITDAYSMDSGSISSGGFSVGWENDEMYLQFIFEQTETES